MNEHPYTSYTRHVLESEQIAREAERRRAIAERPHQLVPRERRGVLARLRALLGGRRADARRTVQTTAALSVAGGTMDA